jgi:hypothetical protein
MKRHPRNPASILCADISDFSLSKTLAERHLFITTWGQESDRKGLCAVAGNVYHVPHLSCVLLLGSSVCAVAIIRRRNSYREMLLNIFVV